MRAAARRAAKELGAQVWVVSEYGHCDVTRPVYLNRVLRTPGLLEVRRGPFGEQLDLYGSRAFAVVDHQLAHVYVRDAEDIPRVKDLLDPGPGRGQGAVWRGANGRSGSITSDPARLILLSEPDCVVRLSVLAERPGRAGLRAGRGDPPQAGLRPVRTLLRSEVPDAEAARGEDACSRRSSASA